MQTAIEKVSHYINEGISNGKFRENQKIESEWNLAKRLEISRSSVHLALARLATEGMVVSVPGKGTFLAQRNNAKNILRGTKIGIVMPNPHFAERSENIYWFNAHDIFLGAQEEARSQGMEVIACTCMPGMKAGEIDSWLKNNIRDGNMKGLIFVNPLGYGHLLQRCLQESIPVAGWDYKPGEYDVVRAGYYRAMYEAVSFLLKSGRRRLLYLGYLAEWGGKEKFTAYRQALEAFNVPFNDKLIIEYSKDDPHLGYTRVTRFVKNGITFDAVVANNDILATDAMAALGEAGLKVPEEIAVTGADDMPGVAELTIPLATLRVPRIEVGRTLFQLLRRRFLNTEAPISQVTLEAKFVNRTSAGCLKV